MTLSLKLQSFKCFQTLIINAPYDHWTKVVFLSNVPILAQINLKLTIFELLTLVNV